MVCFYFGGPSVPYSPSLSFFPPSKMQARYRSEHDDAFTWAVSTYSRAAFDSNRERTRFHFSERSFTIFSGKTSP
ncbi:unnamed protein product [Heterotrigona itama]|uniref:Uncharacterized protein n=1 Tax=Heterotrigona itama TaxID=395501 RepID=A0A6V7H1W1_9HYME|nr:unnamed protein product [Heterotrigona itama]